jgi:integrase/recombinase XerD
MARKRYKALEKCRDEIVDYADELSSGTDDDDVDQRDSTSTDRYTQDLRWFDGWLDSKNIDSAFALTPAQANRLGRELSNEFQGTTPLYRWDRINAMYDYFVAMDLIESNPLSRWDGQKREKWGMTKSTEQEKHLNDGEEYAVTQEEIRLMEQNAGQDRLRNQLLIRLAWHTACRRGELAGIRLDMIDEDRREIRLPASITKNDRERVVVWQASCDGLLRKWLHGGIRKEYLGAESHDHLFVGQRGAPMSPSSINDVIVRSADRAGVNRKLYADANSVDGNPNRWKITSHNIRHGAATHIVNSNPNFENIYALSRYLGHSSVEITEQRYIGYDPNVGARGVRKFIPE